MNAISTATPPAMTLALGANPGHLIAIGQKAVLLLGFNAASQSIARKPAERKDWRDHRPPPRWGINE